MYGKIVELELLNGLRADVECEDVSLSSGRWRGHVLEADPVGIASTLENGDRGRM